MLDKLTRAFGARLGPSKAKIKAPKPATDRTRALQRRVREQAQTIATLEKSKQTTREFLSALATLPWSPPLSAKALHGLHASEPSLVMSLLFALLNRPETRDIGLLGLIRIQARRRLHGFVAELLDQYPADRIPADCPVEALAAYAHDRPDMVEPLARRLFDRGALSPTADVATAQEVAREALIAAAMTGNQALARDILAVAPDADPEDATPDAYGHVLARMRDWTARAGRRLEGLGRPGATRIGVLSYRAPVRPSTNIGDYIQSIATIGLLAPHLPADTSVVEGDVDGGAETVRRILDRARGDGPAASGKADLVWIDRDAPTTTPEGGPVWLIVNGWFMHESGESRFDFPFAENVRPIFLGVHINKPEMLTADTIAYFKRYGPVGARDHFSAQLLTANGIDAFFSGCPTLTLDGVFGQADASGRSGRYHAAHRLPQTPEPDHPLQRRHLDPTVPIKPLQECLEQAWSFLEGYAAAEHVKTPLLHCYLPCRAFATPVDFTNPNMADDPRFEGLIGISEAERSQIKQALKARLAAVMPAIVSGASEDAVYDAWRDACADDVAATRQRMAEGRAALSAAPDTSGPLTAARLTVFAGGATAALPDPADDVVHVVFCYDQNFSAAAAVTLRSLVANTSAKLCVTLLTRGLAEADILALSRRYPDVLLAWIDVSDETFENLNLLRHTTVSTMDRLFLPSLMSYARRAIYLDVDIVVLGDIQELFNLDLGGSALAGRITIFPGWHSGYSLARLIDKQLDDEQRRLFRRAYTLQRPMGHACFNAGVQVLDLEKLRGMNFTGELLKIVGDYGVNDQYAVNLFAGGDFAQIPNEWNHIPTQEWIEAPKLIHYTGYIKPWDAEYSPKAELWRAYVRPEDGLALRPAIEKEWFR